MRIALVCVFALVSSCGSQVKERLIDAPIKKIEEGESAIFELDATESSSIVTSGRLVVKVAEITPKETKVEASADVVTALGAKHVDLKQAINNDILTIDFLEKLRLDKKYNSADIDLFYNGLSREGCDIVTINRLKDYPGTVITPTICIASRKIPKLRIVMRTNGFDVTAAFKMVE